METNTLDLSNFGSLETIGTTIIIVAIFFWIVSIIRVAKDISARTNNHTVQIISILLVTFLTPIIGLPIYHIIKPIGYKKDKMPWREAFISTTTICQNCKTLNAKEHECCIQCGEKLKIKCKECNTYYPHNYSYCPKCGGPNIYN
ncbi:MAG TPA: zinc ribbon domain-containing protein [Candidatus Absconditabacterales bacterium]|nr:zinc ribbon domain-containing protein [Candidatus Absconditabacterales bacterium]